MFVSLFQKFYKKGHAAILFLLIQYLLIFLIPVLAMFFIYSSSVNAIRDQLVEKNSMLIDKSKTSIEQGLEEINKDLQQLENNSLVLNFKNISEPLSGKNVMRASELSKELQNYHLCNSLLNNYYILYESNQMVISPNYISKMSSFYGDCFEYMQNRPTPWNQEWLKTYRDQYISYLSVANVRDMGQHINAVTLIKPVKYLNSYQGITIVMLINNAELQKRLGTIDNTQESSLFIVDQNNNLISSVSTMTQKENFSNMLKDNEEWFSCADTQKTCTAVIGDKKMLVTFIIARDSGWKYIAVQPFESVLSKTFTVKKTIISFMVVDIVVGLLIITLMLYFNGLPIKKMMIMAINSSDSDILNKSGQHTVSVYSALESAFFSLEHKNMDLSKKMEEQKSFLTASFFDKLYNGSFEYDEDAKIMGANLGIQLDMQFYTVVLFSFCGYEGLLDDELLDELNFKRLVFKEQLASSDNVNHRFIVNVFNQNQIILLIAGNSTSVEEEREKVRGTVESATQILEQMGDINVSISVGLTCDNMLKIPQSMNTAKQCLNCGLIMIQDTRIIWYEDIASVFMGYYYPREAEMRLINGIFCGDMQSVMATIDEIFDESILVRRLPVKMIQLLASEFCGSMLRIIDSGRVEKSGKLIMKLNQEIDEVTQIYDVNELKSRIKKLYALCSSIIIDKKNNSDIVSHVISYLNENFMQFDITLSSIAEHFSISQPYLSKLFKEKTNVAVYEYLEKLRIEKACQFLQAGNDSIKGIAERVGYVSSNTFCRAFKRLMGVSASDYREIQHKVS